jgi:hypothetical protein
MHLYGNAVSWRWILGIEGGEDVRLGDLDALYDRVEARYRLSSGEEHKAERALLDAICDSPTIDAIPMEWLNERHRKCCKEWDTHLMDAITVLCNEYHVWQKEQEARM